MPSETQNRDWLFLSESPNILSLDLANGTNVSPAETGCPVVDLYTHRPSESWQKNCERILAEFHGFRERALPISVMLLQKRTPGYGSNGRPPEFGSDSMLSMTGHAEVRMAQLFNSKDGSPIAGLFPFCDATGEPITFEDGRPVGLRLGYHLSFATIKHPQSVNDNRVLNTARFAKLCRECGNLLLGLPAEALKDIWRRQRRTVVWPNRTLPGGTWVYSNSHGQNVARRFRLVVKCSTNPATLLTPLSREEPSRDCLDHQSMICSLRTGFQARQGIHFNGRRSSMISRRSQSECWNGSVVRIGMKQIR